ncbi:RASEF [Cordylochernes scorpioides]|uniref:RASEF n=1 Tax=Cordylochernes scorpioides TaxID=51811 RepID=A0ABY6LEE9_9ARAC|nr:RASEF [Cordylochernes scorpioides]
MSTPRPQPTPSSVTPERTYKVIFIGDASVGKSTFILRVVRGQFVPGLNSTLGRWSAGTGSLNQQLCSSAELSTSPSRQVHLSYPLRRSRCARQVLCVRRFRSITQSYFRKADGIVMMYDCTSERSFLNVRHWLDAVDVSWTSPYKYLNTQWPFKYLRCG